MEALEEDALKFESIYHGAYGREKPYITATKRWLEPEEADWPQIENEYNANGSFASQIE